MIKALRFHIACVLFLQIILCFLYGYHNTYDKRPFSIHQWRQTDCLSITKNYYEEGMHFFKPTIHWQGSVDGKAVSEFPLINYTVACFWKLFGEHESIYRFMVLSIYIVSLLFLFVMVHVTSGSLLYSYFATFIISTSPLLAYYSFSFLADIPALSFAIISLSFFFIYLHNSKKKLLLFSIFFSTLTVLLKASAIPVLIIIGVVSCRNLLKSSNGTAYNRSNLFIILAFLLSGISIFAWYSFALHYNTGNSNGVFLMQTLPVWKMTDRVIETARLLYNVQLNIYLNKGVLITLVLCCLWLLLNLKSLPFYLKASLLISMVSFVGFIVLFFQVFDVHDYYLISTMIFPVIILVCMGSSLKHYFEILSGKKTIAFCIGVFSINAIYCATIVRLRNSENDKLCHFSPFISCDEKNFSDWDFKYYNATVKPLETITPYLRSIGINRNDKVISLSDPSFNVTLYLMDQKGFTLTVKELKAVPGKIRQYKALGANYLILNSVSMERAEVLNKLIGNNIGRYKNVLIYKL